MAAAYDPAVHEAPIVIGHPALDAPAYGWIARLQADGKDLMAQPHQIDPQFAELVRTHRYKKISASFYAPGSTGNPTPDCYYLKHVGFLGAQPPAIKGLKSVNFAGADDEDVITIEFAESDNDFILAQLFSNLRDFFIEQYGTEKADRVLPSYQTDALREYARTPAATSTDYSEPVGYEQPGDTNTDVPVTHTATPTPLTRETPVDKETDTTDLAAENAALKKQLDELNASVQAAARNATHQQNVAFADTLIADAKLAPAGKNIIVAVLDALNGSEEGLEFAEADGTKKPLATAFASLLTSAAPVINFAETATKDNAQAAQAASAEFAEADPDRLSLHSKAQALAKAENISYEAAVKRLI